MPKSCLLEVEAFPDNESLASGNRRAFVKAYVTDNSDMDLRTRVENACEFMGFNLVDMSKVQDIEETWIPAEAVDGYSQRGVGFGKFHSYALDK